MCRPSSAFAVPEKIAAAAPVVESTALTTTVRDSPEILKFAVALLDAIATAVTFAFLPTVFRTIPVINPQVPAADDAAW
jgi:hypothetical protein